ncbi:MAG: EamA family transporter [Planctomycetota bacterium]
MDLGPLLIVLLSAAGHAMWNLLAKQSRHKLVFIGGLYVLAVPLFVPIYLWRGLGAEFGVEAWACAVASGAAKAVYVLLIAQALTLGDLSIAYPVSRTAPALVPLWAVLFLGERLSVVGLLGIACVVGAIFVIHLEGLTLAHVYHLSRSMRTRGTGFALLAALAISIYSVIDKLAVSRYAEPISFGFIHWAFAAAFLAPYCVWRCGWSAVKSTVRTEWRPLVLAAALDIGAYTLILFVMEISKVSYIVAARQMSQIAAIALGAVVLKEEYGGIRLLGGALILAGITLIAFAR